MSFLKPSRRGAAVLGLILLATIQAYAQEDRSAAADRPWSNTADLSVVLTDGNSQATSLSLTNRFTYRWDPSQITLNLSALRSKTVERGEPEVVGGEVRVPEVEATAEAYSADGQYGYRLGVGLLAYAGGGWERDRRAGIQDRFSGVVGLGYEILTGDRHSLMVEVGADYTDEDRVDATGESYAGARSTVTYRRSLTETAKLDAELQVLENVEDTNDLRINSTTSITAGLTQSLALKLTYMLKYDHQPVRILVQPGASNAFFTFDRTDSRLGVALVVNF